VSSDEEVALHPVCRTLTISELAKALGVGRNHCYVLAARDALPVAVIRIGRRLLVSKAAVDELLESRRVEGRAHGQ